MMIEKRMEFGDRQRSLRYSMFQARLLYSWPLSLQEEQEWFAKSYKEFC